MRLDVSVNLLTMQSSSKKKEITIFGGKQKRPNIHISDLTDVFIHFLKKKKIVVFTTRVFENMSILNIGKLVQKNINCKIKIKKINDIRSYNLNSSKLLKTGFKPNYSISYAIKEIKNAHENGKLKNNKKWHTVKWLKHLLKKLND